MKNIETARLWIRDFTPEDAGDLHEILGDAETMRNCEPTYDFDKTKVFLESFCIGRHGAVAAVEKRSQKLIGYILFNKIEPGVYEIGWFFNRSYWRQGYAYEACKAVIDYPSFHILLDILSEEQHFPQQILYVLVVIRDSLLQPLDRFFYPILSKKELCKLILCRGEAMLCRFLQMCDGSGNILWSCFTVSEYLAQSVMGIDVFLCGRFLQKLNATSCIMRDVLTVEQILSKKVLGIGIPSFCGFVQPLQGFRDNLLRYLTKEHHRAGAAAVQRDTKGAALFCQQIGALVISQTSDSI